MKFGVYTNAEAAGDPIVGLTTDEKGKAAVTLLAPGTYYVKETKAPTDYVLSKTIHKVEITPEALTMELEITHSLVPGKVAVTGASQGLLVAVSSVAALMLLVGAVMIAGERNRRRKL